MAQISKLALSNIQKAIDNELKFATYGSFMLSFFMLSVKEQELVSDHLLALSGKLKPENEYVIEDLINLSSRNESFTWQIKHEFKCKRCNQVNSETTNLYQDRVRSYCFFCTEKMTEYLMDQS